MLHTRQPSCAHRLLYGVSASCLGTNSVNPPRTAGASSAAAGLNGKRRLHCPLGASGPRRATEVYFTIEQCFFEPGRDSSRLSEPPQKTLANVNKTGTI